MIDGFGTAVTYIRCFIKAVAALPDKVLTCLITGRAGCALNATNKNLSTSVCFVAVIAMYTKVVCVIKGTFVIPIAQPMFFNLL
jgi:hypothetical protein